MNVEPAEMQRLADMRKLILENIAAGRSLSEGVDPAELRKAIAAMSAGRSQRKAVSSAKAKAKAAPKDTRALDDKLKSLGINLD